MLLMIRGFDSCITSTSRGIAHEIEMTARRVSSTKSECEMRQLPVGFQPGPFDVICARGKEAYNHPGNKRFRSMIELSIEQYSKANSKLEKSLIVTSIVGAVRDVASGGGFVKKEDNGRWVEVGDHLAREKIGQRYVRHKNNSFLSICLSISATKNFHSPT